MFFQTVKDSLINNVLGPAEAGRFQTVGFQRQVKAAEMTLDNLRTAQVFYIGGTFPKSAGRNSGSVQHDVQFRVEFVVSKGTQLDLDVINDPDADNADRALALSELQEASDLADESMDDLFSIVWNILMDANNYDMGLPVGDVASRWIDAFRKDQPVPRGEYVILTGSLTLSLRVNEAIEGDTGVEANSIKGSLEIQGDPNNNTGVEVIPDEET
jgi:hypothetical protein